MTASTIDLQPDPTAAIDVAPPKQPLGNGPRLDDETMQGSARLGWSEDQPRDESGRFGESDSGMSRAEAEAGLRAVGSDIGSPDNPIFVKSAEEAALLIVEGKYVTMDPETVSPTIEELARWARLAREEGIRSPNINLCQISVPDTNVFCADNIGVPRIEMPQLTGEPRPGSVADALPRNDYGEVDVTGMLWERLDRLGVEFHDERVPAGHLKSTQSELSGPTVAGIMESMRAGRTIGSGTPIIVSSDNYVLDGHHRWAAQVGMDYEPGTPPGTVMTDVTRVDMPISELLLYSALFADEVGVGTVDMGTTYQRAASARVAFSESQERDEGGRFTFGSDEMRAAAEQLKAELEGKAPWTEPWMPPVLNPETFQARLGNCYELAGRRVLEERIGVDSRVKEVVHGTISSGDTPPLAHAWTVNTDGSIHEPATDRDYTKESFGVLFHPADEKHYTLEEARVEMVRTGHYGPWDE